MILACACCIWRRLHLWTETLVGPIGRFPSVAVDLTVCSDGMEIVDRDKTRQ